MAIADLNGDGKPDLAVTNANGSTVSALLNTTPGEATTLSFAPNVPFAGMFLTAPRTSAPLSVA